ncbi:MAG: hypothetical protein Ct9H300mP13_4630 [Gammaproteobacteria bacterium]|nr:MAG: hypothetical protein Ct9H300mP13_4630 [Gammaproteobacteria bacterium]
MQSLRLGIDTGGTYTDAVLIDGADQVEASAKVLTNHQDLVSSIRHVLDTLPQVRLRELVWYLCRQHLEPMRWSRVVEHRQACCLQATPKRKCIAPDCMTWWLAVSASCWLVHTTRPAMRSSPGLGDCQGSNSTPPGVKSPPSVFRECLAYATLHTKSHFANLSFRKLIFQ